MIRLVSFLFVLFIANPVFATTIDVLPSQMKVALKNTAVIPSISHVVISTFLMVVIIYLIAFLYQRLSAFNARKFAIIDEKPISINKMKIVNSLSLGANKALFIVEVNDKFLVLGSTNNNISLVKEFDKKNLDELLVSYSSLTPPVAPEVIEQGLDTLFPDENKQEDVVEIKEEQAKESTFDDVYKKYI